MSETSWSTAVLVVSIVVVDLRYVFFASRASENIEKKFPPGPILPHVLGPPVCRSEKGETWGDELTGAQRPTGVLLHLNQRR